MPITETQKQNLKRGYMTEWLNNRVDYYRSQGMSETDIHQRAAADLREYIKPVPFEVPEESMREFVESQF